MAEPIVIIDSDDESQNPTKETPKQPDNEQMECPICLQTCIHPARLPCGHIFCFLCVKGVAYKNRRCALCRREIPVEFLDHPHLLQEIQATSTTTEDGYEWFYEGRNGWWQYDERTSNDIEAAYKKNEKSCTVLVAGYVYVIDFEAMLQKRQNDPSRKRQIKRDLATTTKKGVAGLRIDGTTEHSSYANYTASSSSASSSSALPSSSHHYPIESLASHPRNSSNIISTIAATDAAIRIASDIIDSTLAHADEYRNGHNASSIQSELDSSTSNGSGGSLDSSGNSRRELLHEVEETLNISNASSISSSSPNLDFFSSTIDEFRSLALSNIAETSSDSDNDDDDEDDCNDDENGRHRRLNEEDSSDYEENGGDDNDDMEDPGRRLAENRIL